MSRRRRSEFLKPAVVAEILDHIQEHRYNGVQVWLAKRHGVGESTVSRIVRGNAYTNVARGAPLGRHLDPEIVRDVYRYLKAHKYRGAQRVIAAKHGLSESIVQRIYAGDTYREVTKELDQHA